MSNQKIYSLPDFKEPEKTSSWKPEDRARSAEPKIELRDFELDNAVERTRLIKERMSPPGALRLPPLLDAARLKWGIPDGFFKSQPAFDRVFVFPINRFEGETTYGGTSIFLPNATKERDLQEGRRGILISAGLSAMDRLMSHGIELGHIVTTNKNVPFVEKCERFPKFDMYFLMMREADLAGSETLMEELRSGKKRIVDVGDESGYQHQVATVNEDGTVDVRKKKSVFVADTW
ncbi:MAG TPA: hypothetical protein VFM95_06170 [Microcella sp.]|nr:hypothetical protein [Microcella sp.]